MVSISKWGIYGWLQKYRPISRQFHSNGRSALAGGNCAGHCLVPDDVFLAAGRLGCGDAFWMRFARAKLYVCTTDKADAQCQYLLKGNIEKAALLPFFLSPFLIALHQLHPLNGIFPKYFRRADRTDFGAWDAGPVKHCGIAERPFHRCLHKKSIMSGIFHRIGKPFAS